MTEDYIAMFVGIGTMCALACVAVTLVAYLSKQPGVAARRSGQLLASLVGTFSAVLSVALAADNGVSGLRIAGVLVMIVLLCTTTGTIWALRHGRAHLRVRNTP